MLLYLANKEGYFKISDILPSDFPKIIGGNNIPINNSEINSFIFKNLLNIKSLHYDITSDGIIPDEIANMQQLTRCSIYNKNYICKNNMIVINNISEKCIKIPCGCTNLNIIFNLVLFLSPEPVPLIYILPNTLTTLSLSALTKEISEQIFLCFPISLCSITITGIDIKEENLTIFKRNNPMPYGSILIIQNINTPLDFY